jgi:FkbM family methyltransferase
MVPSRAGATIPAHVGGIPLIFLKNLLFHGVCLRNAPRYFALKARAMQAAARLGVYESADVRRLPFFIRPGSEVVDAGANFGAYTVVMARLAGPAGKVFAFEPLPPAADTLARTCATLSNVVIVREALSDGENSQQTVELQVPFLAGAVPEPALAAVGPAPWADSGLKTWRVFRVPVRRLDDHLASFRDISFIKVDVEGGEAAFLTGATETIRRFRPVLQLESSGLRAHAATVEAWLRDAHYILMTPVGGRLERGTPKSLTGLNAYGVPEEMVNRLPVTLQKGAGQA